MDRYAIFIDAGYVYAGGGELVLDATNRAQVALDHTLFLEKLREVVDSDYPNSGDFLRVYWYDAARDGIPEPEHDRIAAHPGVKVRLGRLTRFGQKGVDALVFRDMMKLSAEHAICTAFLVAGDEDLRQGVLEAQDYGVKVVLIGVAPTIGQNQAAALIHEADQHRVLSYDELRDCFSEREASAERPRAQIDETFDAFQSGYAFGSEWAAGQPADLVAAASGSFLPRDANTELIYRLITDADLPPATRLPPAVIDQARGGFRSALLAAASGAPPVEPARLETSPIADAVPAPLPASAPAVAQPAALASTPFGIGGRFGIEWLDEQPQEEVRYVRANFPFVPRDIDIELLKRLVAALGLPFGSHVDDVDRKAARAGFWEVLGLQLDVGEPRRPAYRAFDLIVERDPIAYGRAFAEQWLERADGAEVERARNLAQKRVGLPADADAQLLRMAAAVFGDPVPVDARHRLRDGFLDRVLG